MSRLPKRKDGGMWQEGPAYARESLFLGFKQGFQTGNICFSVAQKKR